MTSDQRDIQLFDITNNVISEFDKRYLPSNLNVLQRLLYETQIKKIKVVHAVKIVVKEVTSIWEESSIAVKRIDHCKEKLQKLYNSYTEVRKFQDRMTVKVTDFLKEMTDVFDISKDTVIKLLSSMDRKTQKVFLSKPVDFIKSKIHIIESGILSVADENIFTPEDIETINQSASSMIIEPEVELSQKFSQHSLTDEAGSNKDANIVAKADNVTSSEDQSSIKFFQSSSEETSSQGSGMDFAITGRNYESKNERGTIDVMTPKVVAPFDKARVSDRDAVFITGLIADALNFDPKSLILNRKSINIARARIRKDEYEKMKQLFQNTPVTFLVVHWDGKLIPDDTACKKLDKLPVLVSSDKFTKIINVPALKDQKARTTALAVYASLKDWGLLDLTNALCCDTTNVNLGCKGGAALLLEELMDKDLLYLACRRHMFELLLRAAYESKFSGTSGPDVPMFKRFRDNWSNFDVNSFENGLHGLETTLKNEVPFVIQNIENFLKEHQPRDDYKELLELCLIFLGVGEGITIKKPGAIHHARWMAKAIYSIKMYLFRKAFKLTQRDTEKLYVVGKFIVFRYLTPWYTAPLAISAPNNDLKLIKSLIDFKDIDKKISDATLHKFRNHLWYLSPELSILSLFDSEVEIKTKRKIVESLQTRLDHEDDNIKKFYPSDEGIRALRDKTLDYFTNSQSWNFFSRFNLDSHFLKVDCDLWEKDPSYLECYGKLKHLTVVNVCAERAVNLAEEYVNTRSHDEDQKQYLLQFVDESRKNLLASSDKNKLLKKLRTE